MATVRAGLDRWPDRRLPWPIVWDGVLLLAEFEQGPGGGVALKAYRCPAGVWTCGWGETEGIGPRTRWTKDYADRRFCDAIDERVQAVRAMCSVEPTDAQLAALVCLSYNIGTNGLRGSSVMRAHNRGDFAAAGRAFSLWNKARNPTTGRLEVLNGLTRRRAREAALYLTSDVDDAPEPMPQSVQPESSLASSPISGSGALVGGTGAVAAIQAAGDQAGMAKGALDTVRGLVVDTLGIPTDWVLPAVLLSAGVAVVWWRWKQRRDGWA